MMDQLEDKDNELCASHGDALVPTLGSAELNKLHTFVQGGSSILTYRRRFPVGPGRLPSVIQWHLTRTLTNHSNGLVRGSHPLP